MVPTVALAQDATTGFAQVSVIFGAALLLVLVALLQSEPAQCFEHFDLDCPEMGGDRIGGESAPVVFLTAACEELATYIREDPSGPFADELRWPAEPTHSKNGGDAALRPFGRLADWGFQPCSREPFLLKADWHSVRGWGDEIGVFVPRMDAEESVRRAPPRLVAFAEALREANGACWRAMVEALERLRDSAAGDAERRRLFGLLADALRERGHFAAVEAQGGPTYKKHNMRWHRDGATGLLHLAITLGGRRRLMFRVGDGEKASRRREVVMFPGSFYVTAPFLFDHAVRYETKGPTLALMCRFGFLSEADALWVNHLRSPAMLEAAKVVAGCLRSSTDRRAFRLPTLQEVKDMEALHARGRQ